jgi:hypothetical protein
MKSILVVAAFLFCAVEFETTTALGISHVLDLGADVGPKA